MKKITLMLLVIAVLGLAFTGCPDGSAGSGNWYFDRLTGPDGYGFWVGGDTMVVILKEFASGDYYMEHWEGRTMIYWAMLIDITKDEFVFIWSTGEITRQKYHFYKDDQGNINYYGLYFEHVEFGALVSGGYYHFRENIDWYVKH